MIKPHWKRISGVHSLTNGTIGAVWLAWDGDTDLIHVYDACLFKREVLAVIAEGINARGRWIPVAWQSKEVSDKLYERGCNMMADASDETDAIAEMVSRDIWERMRSGRFKVDKRLKEWLDEYQTFKRDGAKVPRDSHPLMGATRHAMAELRSAKAEQSSKPNQKNYRRVAIV